VFFEIIEEPSIKEARPKIVNVVETPDWRGEIMTYLRGHYEPQDELQEKRLKQRARGYAVVNGELYKSGVTEPLLRCITCEKGLELLREIHSGFCGAHIGTRALAGKTIKQGFFLKQLWGKAPPATNILIKGEEPTNLQRASKEAGGRGHLTSS
jgi:hypothetical protein